MPLALSKSRCELTGSRVPTRSARTLIVVGVGPAAESAGMKAGSSAVSCVAGFSSAGTPPDNSVWLSL